MGRPTNPGWNYNNPTYLTAFGGPPPGASIPKEIPDRGAPKRTWTPQELAVIAPSSFNTPKNTKEELTIPETNQKYENKIPSFNIDEFQSLLSKLESSKKAQVAQKGAETHLC